MRRTAIVFILAIFLPSLLLAWLAVRSLRDQQFVLERQQSLLYQGVADALALRMQDFMNAKQREFSQRVDEILSDQNPRTVASAFDERLRAAWPLAQVGFAVTLDGTMCSPSLGGNQEGKLFRQQNDLFLGNREVAEVYPSQKAVWNVAENRDDQGSFTDSMHQAKNSWSQNDSQPQSSAVGSTQFESATSTTLPQVSAPAQKAESRQEKDLSSRYAQAAMPASDFKADAKGSKAAPAKPSAPEPIIVTATNDNDDSARMKRGKKQDAFEPLDNNRANYNSTAANASFNKLSRKSVARSVTPEKEIQQALPQLSKTTTAEAEFRQLVGEDTSGAIARFLENKLTLLLWYRSPRDPQLVFGAQLLLPAITQDLARLVQVDSALGQDICVALLDENGRPVARTHPSFSANWKHPFVASEIGEALPHWEIAVYLVNPDKLNQTARTLAFTLSLMIVILLFAIGIGGWLIVADTRRQLAVARQKTDFVSNVSHELKTPLTSIRMFSELLSSGRVLEETKQRSYLQIIATEAARLTRLINNVLDFARIERGEKKYDFQDCDLVTLVNETVANYRPHLEAGGFTLDYEPTGKHPVIRADRDAISQVLLNLLSNAEKYGAGRKAIVVETRIESSPRSVIRIRVLDRGNGVPRGAEEKIFEQFYRAHDSLSSGIQGSGLGLTLARQIARAHGGDITHAPRDGGGSVFTLELPIPTPS